MKLALLLTYDGTNYHGWQTQKNAVTVCETVHNALLHLPIRAGSLCGCGRTDAGVHASYYVAHVHVEPVIPPERMPFALNSLLPKDIRVLDCVEVGQSFMAIESIIAKEYTYVIYSAPHMLPLWQNRVYHYPEHLDLAVMQRAAADFEGTHDFACVQSTGTVVKSTIRTMLEFEVRQEGNLFVFRMKATGFLYNMARSLAGTLLYMSREKICAVAPLIATRNRNLAGPTLPPQGLYMTGVWYAEEPFGPCSGCTSMPWEIGL